MEWLWYYLVTSDPQPCPDVTGDEFLWAAGLPYYEHLDFPERVRLINVTKAVAMQVMQPDQHKNKKKHKWNIRLGERTLEN
jgi:hypothetical protein